ncbi:MAG: HAMP domain-containing histidine kinase [Thiotrichales bacterium]|nr:HAMP domain-containing histidine kinase [Thiotrichales bacterium]
MKNLRFTQTNSDKTWSSLRGRIGFSYQLLTWMLSLFFIVLSYQTLEYVEDDFLQAKLEAGLETMWPPNETYQKHGEYQLYLAANLPDYLQPFPQDGKVYELDYLDQELAVMRGERDGLAYTLTWNHHSFEVIERAVLALFLATALMGGLLAWFFSRYLVQISVLPLNRLTQAVAKGEMHALPAAQNQDEIGYLAQAILQRDQELVAFLQRETHFAQDASHELRTPLAIILGAAEVLQAQIPADSPQHIHLKRIQETAQEAADLVAALLSLARQAHGGEDEPVDIGQLLQQESRRYQTIYQAKGFEFHLAIEADVIQAVPLVVVKVILGNLLRNAFDYSTTGPIQVGLNAQGFWVQNGGKGVATALQSKLFERYARGQNPLGHGIGLSLVKRLAEQMGWQVGYQNSIHSRALFWVAFHKDFQPPAA